MNPDNNGKVHATGIGCICAPGNSIDECMDSMFSGSRNPGLPTRFSTDHDIEYPVFQINPDHINQALPDKSNLTLTSWFALEAVSQALADAGITKEDLKSLKVGVCMGTTVGCALNNDPFYIDYKQGRQPGMEPIKRFLNNNPAACVAEHLGISGPVQTIVNACASGTDAIGTGAMWIKSGICDLVIAGGTDELCKVTYNGFISLMITDSEPCRPFDASRKGLNLGEGAGAVILQSEASMKTLSNSSQCTIAGYASACDAYHLTAPKPDGPGLTNALTLALEESNFAPSQIGFVNAHGTGTKDNDKTEDMILSKLLPSTPFFSTKGYTGHTLGAAGAIEAVFTIRHLLDQKIPASIGFTEPGQGMNQAPVQQEREISCQAAISQSLAFGGNNSVLVFAKV